MKRQRARDVLKTCMVPNGAVQVFAWVMTLKLIQQRHDPSTFHRHEELLKRALIHATEELQNACNKEG